jgi:hypothetical protein
MLTAMGGELVSRKGERNQRLQAGKANRKGRGYLPSMEGAAIAQFDSPEEARRKTLHVPAPADR